MSNETCKFHVDHENRLSNVEVRVKELEKSRINPAVWVALLAFCSTMGSVTGQVLIAYMKLG